MEFSHCFIFITILRYRAQYNHSCFTKNKKQGNQNGNTKRIFVRVEIKKLRIYSKFLIPKPITYLGQ